MFFLRFLRDKYFELIILFFILIFWQVAAVKLDPDFGWHIRIGQLILENGLPKTEPFSYAAVNYAFTDHEWLLNITLAKLLPLLKYWGLAFIFALIAICALLINVSNIKRKWVFLPFVLSAVSLLPFSGVRTQVITWFFVSVVIKFVLNDKLWNKWRFVLPILFLIWANLHGGFMLGLLIIALEIINKMFKKKKILFSDILVFILCVIITLINPFGFSLWKLVWLTASDNSLKETIAEFSSGLYYPNLIFWFFFAFSVVLIWRYKNKFSFFEILLYLLFFAMGLSSVRNIPFWIIISFPMTAKGIGWFYEEVKHFKEKKLRFKKAFNFLTILVFTVSAVMLVIILESSYLLSERSIYPVDAIKYLEIHNTKGEIFSIYDWGGYLDWKLKNKKVFIDGRLAGQTNVFKEYQDILNGKTEFKKIARKYNIDTVLVTLPQEKNKKKTFLKDLNEWLSNIISKSDKKGKYPDIYTQLKNDNWVEVYKDKVAVVYRRKT